MSLLLLPSQTIYHKVDSVKFFLTEQGTKDYSLWVRGPVQIKCIFSNPINSNIPPLKSHARQLPINHTNQSSLPPRCLLSGRHSKKTQGSWRKARTLRAFRNPAQEEQSKISDNCLFAPQGKPVTSQLMIQLQTGKHEKEERRKLH